MNTTCVLATLVYLVCDNRTLMIHRVSKEGDLHAGKYNGLGGKFEEGERPIDCARREFLEESGLQLKHLNLKGLLYFPKFDKLLRDWRVFVYKATHYEGELIAQSAEGVLKWIPNEDVLDLNLWDGDQYFLPYIYNHSMFDGVISYRDGDLVDHKITVF